MRRFMSFMACLAACSLGISTALAGGPGCSAKASGDKVASTCNKSASSCCEMGEFPTLVRMVGDKAVGCPMTAEKMAKESNSKVMFAVCGQKFEKENEAWAALADCSEMYVKKFTTIAATIDGKTYFVCDEGAAGCCKSGAKTASAAGCCKGDKAKMASGSTCGSKSDVKSATAAGSCHGKGEAKDAKVVRVKEKSAGSSCSAKGAQVDKAEGKGCSKSCVSKTGDGSDCCKKGEATKMAIIDSKTCTDMCKKAKETKFMVAGHSYATFDAASKARTEVLAAIGAVKMKYIVDGKEVGCSSQVCPKAKAAGHVKYVVGEKNMDCELMARVELAKAQYDAAKKVESKAVATKM